MTTENQAPIGSVGQLVESNRRNKKYMSDFQTNALNESIKRSFKVDMTDKTKFNFDHPMFSWKKFRENAYKLAESNFQEANAENTLGALLRNGINMIANNWYELVPTSHEMIAQTVTSTHAAELYAPLGRGGIPRRVVKGGQYPRTKLVGLDIQMSNVKFGAIIDFERELFDDDQTGQISERAKDIGANMSIMEDAYTFQRFIGTAGSFSGDTIPASQTYPAGPFQNVLTGGGSNRPSTYLAFTQANVQAAHLALVNQVDASGNKMLVNPNTLLVGVNNTFTAKALLFSTNYPSTASLKIGGGAGTDSTIGTTFAKNTMEGMYNLVVSRFMPAKAWAIGEAGKGFVFQRRDALEVTQENPQSGQAFSCDIYQFKSRARFEADWVDPHFWYLGNDGSV